MLTVGRQNKSQAISEMNARAVTTPHPTFGDARLTAMVITAKSQTATAVTEFESERYFFAFIGLFCQIKLGRKVMLSQDG